MKLTIIPSDNLVSIDNLSYTVEIKNLYTNIHAVQWADNAGWIEYTDKPNENITDISQFQQAINLWNEADNQSKVEYINTAEDNKNIASAKLAETDWVELLSVTDSTQPVYLTNKKEFDNYRLQLRLICINPSSGNITFPSKPNSIWNI
jgi:hypothetical protein